MSGNETAWHYAVSRSIFQILFETLELNYHQDTFVLIDRLIDICTCRLLYLDCLYQISTMSPNNKAHSISSRDEIEERNEIDKDCNEVEGSSCRNCLSELQKKQVSIDDIMDVLKALMLLGFASWSGLEEGKYYKRKLVAQIKSVLCKYILYILPSLESQF